MAVNLEKLGWLENPVGRRRVKETTLFLGIYFNVCYYLFMTPFRIKLDMTRQQFTVHKWKPQQVLCAFAHVLGLTHLFIAVRREVTQLTTTQRNPVEYFDFVKTFVNLFFKVCLFHIFWRNSTKFCNVLNYLNGFDRVNFSCEKILHAKPRWCKMTTTRALCYTIHVFYIMLSLSSLIVGRYFVPSIYEWTPTSWYEGAIEITRYTFFYNLNSTEQFTPASISDNVLIAFTVLTLVYRYLWGFYADLFILFVTLTLWSSANSFSANINQLVHTQQDLEFNCGINFAKISRANHWPIIYYKFTKIRQLSHVLNDAAGHAISWFLFKALFFQSSNLDSVLTSPDAFQRVEQSGFVVLMVCILFFAADICRKLESIKFWLVQPYNKCDVRINELDDVYHEMISKDVGIRGSDIFTITFSFVASFLSTIVTFFIICVQQKI